MRATTWARTLGVQLFFVHHRDTLDEGHACAISGVWAHYFAKVSRVEDAESLRLVQTLLDEVLEYKGAQF
jgi:16S rRNA U1498 N3-methylase RsmE